jgi:hypothetical protein
MNTFCAPIIKRFGKGTRSLISSRFSLFSFFSCAGGKCG